MHVKNELQNPFSTPDSAHVHDLLVSCYDRQNRAADALQFFLTAAGLILIAPVLCIIALLIKLTSRGPLLYRGLRVGKQRRLFNMYKFRTLKVGAEDAIGARLLKDDDSFYTPIGKFLKRTKLDELPQLFNVLKGDMNLVGPRPIRPIFLETLSKTIPLYDMRFAVKPGMTGIAQIRAGYFTAPKDKLRYELIYLRNRSVFLDLKLIYLTFLKLLNRWFTLSFLYIALFLFTSFIPSEIFPLTIAHIFGFRLNLVHLFIILGGGWLLAKKLPHGELYLYRAPVNLPMLLFFTLALLTSYFAPQPFIALRGSVYYAVTGFMIVLLIINGKTTPRFIKNTTRMAAVLAVAVSIIGLFELFLMYQFFVVQAEAGLAHMAAHLPRISSTLGNPVILSTYLVLGLPLLLCELANATSKRARDVWLICATAVFTGIVLTQSRTGLLALAVTGAVFFWRRPKRQLVAFVVGFGILFLIMQAVGGPRYSPRQALLEWSHTVLETAAHIAQLPLGRLLIGAGTNNAEHFATASRPGFLASSHAASFPPSNMHLILLIENGLAGWLLMMWLLVAVLRRLHTSYHRVKDGHLQMILWAIFSSTSGFLVSMNSLEAFQILSTQVLFWSLLGIGTAIATRFTHKRAGFARLWRFGN